MPNLADNITDIVLGDSLLIRRTVTGLPDARTVVLAFFTLKITPTNTDLTDTDKLIQKIVTSVVSAAGQITDAGSGSYPARSATVELFLLPADTLVLKQGVKYAWDIQVKLDNGDISTPFKGVFSGVYGVTNKTAP